MNYIKRQFPSNFIQKMLKKETLALVVNSQDIDVDITQIDKNLKQLYKYVITRRYPESSEAFSRKRSIQITDYEVIKLIWRDISEQINQKPIQAPFQSPETTISELIQHLKQYEQSFLADVPSLNHSLQEQLEQIKNQIKNLITESKSEAETQQNHDQMMTDITSYLEDCILSTQKKLFVESLCGIRQLEDSSLQFIFEPSYPTITYQEDEAIQIFGQTVIKNKKQAYSKYFKQYFLEKDHKLMLFCHYCQSPCPVKYFQCSNDSAKSSFPSCVLIDPYMYYRRILSRQLYGNENDENGPKSYFHPFEKYYQDKKKYLCNRIFCQKCKYNDIHEKNLLKAEKKGICSFCQGLCSCCRCMYHEDLVKLMGIYLHFGGDLDKVIEKFVFKFSDDASIYMIPPDKLNKRQDFCKTEINKIAGSLMKLGVFRPFKDIKAKQCFYFSSKFESPGQQQKKLKENKQLKQKEMRRQRKKDRIKAKRQRKSELRSGPEFPDDINNVQLEQNKVSIFYNDSESEFENSKSSEI